MLTVRVRRHVQKSTTSQVHMSPCKATPFQIPWLLIGPACLFMARNGHAAMVASGPLSERQSGKRLLAASISAFDPRTEMDAVRRRQWVSPSGLHFEEGPIPEGRHPLPRSGIIETREGLFLLVPSTRCRFACKRYTHSIGAIGGNSICRKQLRSWLAAWSPQPFPSVPKHGAFADKAFTMALMVLACATVCRLAWS